MSPRPRLPSPRFDFRGGVNTAFSEDVLDATELRAATNARSVKGGYAQVLGSRRVHTAALAGGKPVTGLVQWDAPTGPQIVAIANGQLFFKAEADAEFTAGPAGMSTTRSARFATYRVGSAVFLLIADGALWKWDGTTLSNLTTVGAPAAIDLAVYKLRVFAIIGTKTVFWSKIGDPTLWAPADGGGFDDVETFDTEPLAGLLVVGSSLLLAKARNIARFTGTDANDIQIDTGTEGVSNSIGVLSPRTFIELDGGAFFVSGIGPAAATEAGAQAIGTKVSDQFLGQDVGAWAAGVAVRYDERNEIWVWLPSGAAWIYSEDQQNWSGPITIKPGTAVCRFVSDDGTATFLRGGADGFVRREQIEGTTAEDQLADGTGGTPQGPFDLDKVGMQLTTPPLLFGSAAAVKRLADGQSIEADLGADGAILIVWSSELGTGVVLIQTLGAGMRSYDFRLGAKGRRITLRISAAGSAPTQINGITPVASLSSSSAAPQGTGQPKASFIGGAAEQTIAIGAQVTLTVLAQNDGNQPLVGKLATAVSDHPEIATVTASGTTDVNGEAAFTVTGVAPGADGLAAIVRVTVAGVTIGIGYLVADAVDHLDAPDSIALTLALDPVDHLDAPDTVTLDAPSAPGTPAGAIDWFAWGRTLFGSPQPSDDDIEWSFGPDFFRFVLAMSGGHTLIQALNRASYRMPYALHHFCEATGQEPTEGVGSSWGTLAEEWAADNVKNVEKLFLHADDGQETNVAVLVSVSATGLITFGRQASNNKQQLSQARAGVAASDAFIPGQQYHLRGVTGIADDTIVTITGEPPSTTTVQTDYAGAAGTGGRICRLGDGTPTKANRTFRESQSDWVWEMNPGSDESKAFQVHRFGLLLGATENAVFWDSHSASNMHFKSVEYGQTSNIQYVNDICALFALYRAAFPGTLSFPNLANFVTTQDDQFAEAAGGCQMEGALNIFQAQRPNDGIGTDVIRRLQAGVVVELGFTPTFDGAQPHAGAAGLTTAFRASGAHRYSTVDDRGMMTCYAAALCLVDGGTRKKLICDPANLDWTSYPLSARWEPVWENTPLGQPVDAITPPKFVYASGTGAVVLGRVFSQDGTATTDLTAIALMRVFNGTATHDASTNFQVPIQQDPPAGKTWGIADDKGVVTGSLVKGDLVDLWNIDSAILVAH